MRRQEGIATLERAVLSMLKDVARQIESRIPDCSASLSHSASEVFPLSVTLGFCRAGDATGDDLVVVSIDGKLQGAVLSLGADISRGDGFVLLEGPRASLLPAVRDEAAQEVFVKWVDALREFMDTAADAIAAELGQ